MKNSWGIKAKIIAKSELASSYQATLSYYKEFSSVIMDRGIPVLQ